MGNANVAERRGPETNRRQTARAIRCEHCKALLTFDRRGSVVGMYRSASAMPVHSYGDAAPGAPATQPRCVVCNQSLLPAA
jgi:hypothetical protein